MMHGWCNARPSPGWSGASSTSTSTSRRGSRAIKGHPAPPAGRKRGRNAEWGHLNNADVISMPDKWEYPWYAAWDLAFHCIPLALIDSGFAKHQLELLTREWYMHPNGQIPAYEWAFGDVNPPVHAWSAWRVYQIDRKQKRRQGRRQIPGAGVSQAHVEFHLVGESQGRRRSQCVSGRISGPGQHRRVRPQRASCPPAATSTNPTARAGWPCTPSISCASRWSSRSTTTSTKTSPASSSSTFCTSPRR